MIRMGMIGCGSMARAFMARLAPLSDRMKFTALVDIDPTRMQAAAEAAPEARHFTDYREALEAVDAVIIALPHDLHHRVTLDCLAAGVHVMLEKPTAMTEQQCLELVAADRTPNPVLMIGYVMRYDPLWQAFGQLLKNQTYGLPFQVSIWTEQYTDTSRGEWVGQAARVGGGQLFSHGCHYIDLLLSWLGEPVEGTHLGTNLGTPWMQREGTSNVAIRFKSGAIGYHFGTWGARGSRLGYAVHAHCTEGMLELDRRAGVIWLHRDRSGGDLPAMIALAAAGETLEEPNRVIIHRDEAKGDKPAHAEIAAFLDCIEQRKTPLTDVRSSVQSLRVIWRMYQAEDQHKVADLSGLGLEQFSDQPDPVLASGA